MAEKLSQKIKEKIKKKLPNLFAAFFNTEKIGGLLLIFCTIISLTISNFDFGQAYAQFEQRHLDLSFAGLKLDYSLEHWVNDGLMAIFFLMVGLEVERELYIGELSQFKHAILPLSAAVGGIVLPSLIHYFFNEGTPTQSGFAIPMATDIAFALGMLALVGNKVPTSVKVFLTALAIIDDIGAIIVIALFYTKTVLFGYLAMALGILGALLVLNRLKIHNLIFYLVPGIVVWYCFLKSGVHATIAGVLLAFVIPFDDNDADNDSNRLLHFLHKPVAFFIVPIFALVNTSIIIPDNIVGALSDSNSLGIMIGLLVGKVSGIFLFPYLIIKLGWAKLQPTNSLKNLVGIGFLGGIGFTMSMFITNLAFDDRVLVGTSKLSILIASTVAAILGLLVFKSNPPAHEVEEATS